MSHQGQTLLFPTDVYSHGIVDVRVASYKMELLIAFKLSTKRLFSYNVINQNCDVYENCMRIWKLFVNSLRRNLQFSRIIILIVFHTYFGLYSWLLGFVRKAANSRLRSGAHYRLLRLPRILMSGDITVTKCGLHNYMINIRPLPEARIK